MSERPYIGTVTDGRYCVMASWDDVPHLLEAEKAALWATLPPYQRDARTKGIPQLGSGAIFPISESSITEDDIKIPPYWPRCYAMDVGWNFTAALWMAWDRESDCIHIYSAYKREQAEPLIHAAAIRARGWWIPGVIDPASRGRSQVDGQQLIKLYRELDLDITPADNSVESGIFTCWQRMNTGRLKVFKSCSHFFEEFRLYRRDEKGKVVKKGDHLMDCLRYGVMSGLKRALATPMENWDDESRRLTWEGQVEHGRNSVTGY